MTFIHFDDAPASIALITTASNGRRTVPGIDWTEYGVTVQVDELRQLSSTQVAMVRLAAELARIEKRGGFGSLSQPVLDAVVRSSPSSATTKWLEHNRHGVGRAHRY